MTLRHAGGSAATPRRTLRERVLLPQVLIPAIGLAIPMALMVLVSRTARRAIAAAASPEPAPTQIRTDATR